MSRDALHRQTILVKSTLSAGRPMPLSHTRFSMRNWLLPAHTEWSGAIACRTQAGKYGSRPVA
ncbi:MAG: hypothetical protein IVW51_03595 [Thermaceae bacterium]|nr:hypothetical protein [Thermaceae bacterium]